CSTPVVTNKASPSNFLIEASWAERSVASGVIVSVTPIFTPLLASAFANSAAAPRPKSLLTDRKSAFLIGGLKVPSFSTKATASISEVGLMRNTHGLPDTVILPEDEVSTISGTPYSTSLGMTASVKVELQAPIITGTLSRR